MITLADVVRQYHGELAGVFRVNFVAAMHKSALSLPAKVLVKWVAHCKHAGTGEAALELDRWLRRRLRMCFWKQWRKPRRRTRALIKLGVNVREAISFGLSRKSHW